MKTRSLLPEVSERVRPGSLVDFRDSFERLFDEWFSSRELGPSLLFEPSNGGYVPRIDVLEKDEALEVTAELPGIEPNNVEVDLNQDYLTIRGKKEESAEKTAQGYYRHERSYGAFRRDITLPFEVEGDKSKAEFHAGVLKVTLPKAPEAQQRAHRIKVHAT